MELRSMRVFVFAAKYLNFSKVADNLFLSQSSVSKYVSALERELGHELFKRDTKNVTLTEFGKAFLPYASRLLEEEEAAVEFLRGYGTDAVNRVITLGVAESMAYAPPSLFLFQLIKSINGVRKNDPTLRIRLKYYPDDELLSLLKNRRLDVVVLSCERTFCKTFATEGFEYLNPEYQRNVLIYCPNKGMYTGLEEAAPHIDALAYAHDPTPKQLTRRLTRELGIDPVLMPCGNWSELFALVLEERCFGIIPQPLLQLAGECGLGHVDLNETYTSCLSIIWNKAEDICGLDSLVAEMSDKLRVDSDLCDSFLGQ